MGSLFFSSEDQSGKGIFGQSFDNDGHRVGNEFQVNTFSDNNQQIARSMSPFQSQIHKNYVLHYSISLTFTHEVVGCFCCDALLTISTSSGPLTAFNKASSSGVPAFNRASSSGAPVLAFS